MFWLCMRLALAARARGSSRDPDLPHASRSAPRCVAGDARVRSTGPYGAPRSEEALAFSLRPTRQKLGREARMQVESMPEGVARSPTYQGQPKRCIIRAW